MVDTSKNAKCPKCGREPVTVYTTNRGERMCGKCMQKAGKK